MPWRDLDVGARELYRSRALKAPSLQQRAIASHNEDPVWHSAPLFLRASESRPSRWSPMVLSWSATV